MKKALVLGMMAIFAFAAIQNVNAQHEVVKKVEQPKPSLSSAKPTSEITKGDNDSKNINLKEAEQLGTNHNQTPATPSNNSNLKSSMNSVTPAAASSSATVDKHRHFSTDPNANKDNNDIINSSTSIKGKTTRAMQPKTIKTSKDKKTTKAATAKPQR